MSDYKHSGHMWVLQPEKRQKFLRKAKAIFRATKPDFDTIAFSGMSGAVFAPMLAHYLKKELIMVRKGADLASKGHSAFNVEGYQAVKRYIIVDDLVSTGTTVKYIHDQIKNGFTDTARCVGVYCYLADEYSEPRFLNSKDYRIREFIYCESSVPKIEAADDPTVVEGIADVSDDPTGGRTEQLDDGTWLVTCAGSASGRFTSIEESDVPSESEAMDLPF